jgi:hypothetical protein
MSGPSEYLFTSSFMELLHLLYAKPRLASTKSTLDTSNQEKYFSIATITDSQLSKSQRKREVLN